MFVASSSTISPGAKVRMGPSEAMRSAALARDSRAALCAAVRDETWSEAVVLSVVGPAAESATDRGSKPWDAKKGEEATDECEEEL